MIFNFVYLSQLNKKPRRNRMQERLDANVDAASTSSTSSSSRLCVVCPIEQVRVTTIGVNDSHSYIIIDNYSQRNP